MPRALSALAMARNEVAPVAFICSITGRTLAAKRSKYFCCILAGNTEFVRKYPAATKRVLRAILKATDLWVSEPRRVAQLMIDHGYATRSDYVLQMLNELPYAVWRDYDPEDTIRFYGCECTNSA
jgi:ABC-type nitrate/sulfonate/bicarbonate transport system substrate-binding protein